MPTKNELAQQKFGANYDSLSAWGKAEIDIEIYSQNIHAEEKEAWARLNAEVSERFNKMQQTIDELFDVDIEEE